MRYLIFHLTHRPADNFLLKMIRSLLLLLLLVLAEQGCGFLERGFLPLMIVKDGGVLIGLSVVRSVVFGSSVPCRNLIINFLLIHIPSKFWVKWPRPVQR